MIFTFNLSFDNLHIHILHAEAFIKNMLFNIPHTDLLPDIPKYPCTILDL